MSYHILHQFDEQWLADLRQGDGKDKGKSFLSSFDDGRGGKPRARLGSRESHYWGVIAIAILMATFALLFALDASHRAEVLQDRLDAVEKTIKK